MGANRLNAREITLCGFFAALLCLCSLFKVPLPVTPVPVTLQTFAVGAAGLILGKKYGFISVAVYILIGAAGIPVFAGNGGPGALFGNSGGFLMGFLPAVYVIGFVSEKLPLNKNIGAGVAMAVGSMIIYACGSLWYGLMAQVELVKVLSGAVLPFIPGDIIKAVLAILVAGVLREPVKILLRRA